MTRLAIRSSLCCLALLWVVASNIPSAFADDAIVLDPALKNYMKVSGVSGNVNSIGSDTLNNLMTLWAEGFRKQYPNVKIQIEGKGSSTAPPALIEGTAQLGPMSRAMKNTEVDAFERKFRYKPTVFPVAIDADQNRSPFHPALAFRTFRAIWRHSPRSRRRRWSLDPHIARSHSSAQGC